MTKQPVHLFKKVLNHLAKSVSCITYLGSIGRARNPSRLECLSVYKAYMYVKETSIVWPKGNRYSDSPSHFEAPGLSPFGPI